MRTTILFVCIIVGFYFSNRVIGFSIDGTLVEPSHFPQIGSTLILTCVSSSTHEHCTWIHNDNVCRFDWDRRHRYVQNSICKAYGKRLTFLGIYWAHECKMKLTNVTESDSGKWTCEMEHQRHMIFQDINIKVISRPHHRQNAMNNGRQTESEERNTNVMPRPANQQNTLEKEDDLLRLLQVLLFAK